MSYANQAYVHFYYLLLPQADHGRLITTLSPLGEREQTLKLSEASVSRTVLLSESKNPLTPSQPEPARPWAITEGQASQHFTAFPVEQVEARLAHDLNPLRAALLAAEWRDVAHETVQALRLHVLLMETMAMRIDSHSLNKFLEAKACWLEA